MRIAATSAFDVSGARTGWMPRAMEVQMTRNVSLAFLLAFLLPATGAVAQTPTGTITGSVIDQSGAAIPGASVRITNKDTNEEKELRTDPAGRFVQPFL